MNSSRRFDFIDFDFAYMIAYEPLDKSLHMDVKKELDETLTANGVSVYDKMNGFINKKDSDKVRKLLENKGWKYEKFQI